MNIKKALCCERFFDGVMVVVMVSNVAYSVWGIV